MNRRMEIGRGAAIVAMVALLAGCASFDSVRQEHGQGVKRIFKQPYDPVFAAVLKAAGRRKLEIVSSSPDSGTVLLSGKASLSSPGGERIAVFVSRVNGGATGVEVVARPVVPTVSFPPDWPELLFGEVEEILAEQRLSR
ncbi:MAG TPA: hypothetical protein VMT94_08665 [Burkholderiales bacterium]|nr:hypothetical protein [Burkholderiales bacterium]